MPAPGERGNSPSRSPADQPEADCVPCTDLVDTVVLVALMIFLVIYSLRYQIFVDFVVLCFCWFMELLANNILLSFDAGLPQIDPTAGRAEENHNNAGEIVAQQEITSPVLPVALPTSTSSVEFESSRHERQSSGSTAPVLKEIFLSQLSTALHLAIISFSIEASSGRLTSTSSESVAKMEDVFVCAATSTEAAMTCFEIAVSRLECVTWEQARKMATLKATTADNERLRAQNSEAETKIATLDQQLSDTIRKAEAASLEWKERLDVLERRITLFEWAEGNLDPITKEVYSNALEAQSPTNLGNARKGGAMFGKVPAHVLAKRTSIMHTER